MLGQARRGSLPFGVGTAQSRQSTSGFERDVTPTDVDGLAAHYDATDADSFTFGIGSAVSQWDDLSGNARHISQGTALNQPTRETSVQNGNAVVRFDGSADFLRATGFTITQPTTIFIVASQDDNTGTQHLFDSADANDRQAIYAAGTDLRYFAGTVQSVGTADTSWHYFTATFDGASSSIRRDGTELSTANPGTQSLVGLTLGDNYLNSAPLDGDIGEMLVYDAAITGADRNALEAYLADKWGL